MKIVTGATGMLGAHFLYALALGNTKVVGLYRTEEKKDWVKQLFAFFNKKHNRNSDVWQHVIWRKADLLNTCSLEDVLEDATEVYHCAANVAMVTKKPEAVLKNNIEGTENLVNQLLNLKTEVKLLHVSSIAALGKPEKGNTVSVKTEWKTDGKHSAYADSKYYSEMEVWRASEEGLKVVSVLPGVIIGAAPWHSASVTPFKLVSKGTRFAANGLVGLVSVCDVVKQSIAIMKQPEAFGKRYVIVADSWTFKLFMETVANALGKKQMFKVLSKKALKKIGKLERFKSLFTGKPVKLNSSTIDALTNKNDYDGKAIVETTKVEYSSLKNAINDVAIWLRSIS